MPRQLFDEAGAPIEVPTDEELAQLKEAQAEASGLKEEIRTLQDKSPAGMKALRDALGRKEQLISTLQAQLGQTTKLSPDEIKQTATEAAQKVLVDAELAKLTQGMKEEDAKAFKAKYDKLTAGEQVTVETVAVFAEEASRAAGLRGANKPTPIHTGRGPRIEDGEKKFGETDEGKAFASRLGIQIEPKKTDK